MNTFCPLRFFYFIYYYLYCENVYFAWILNIIRLLTTTILLATTNLALHKLPGKKVDPPVNGFKECKHWLRHCINICVQIKTACLLLNDLQNIIVLNAKPFAAWWVKYSKECRNIMKASIPNRWNTSKNSCKAKGFF